MNTQAFWLRYLPSNLRVKIEHRENLQKILSNTGWLFLDKILRMGFGLFIGIWIARYLGPEQFGLFNFTTAIVSLFTAIATLGLNSIVVRDLVKRPDDANSILGTAFILQLIGGISATIAAIIAVNLMRPDDAIAKTMVAIFGSAMIFKATDVIRYWFEARVQSKYIVWVENAAFILFSAVKIILIIVKAKLLTFIWIAFTEVGVVAFLLIATYIKKGNQLKKWQYHYTQAKTLLRDSWPLILSGLATMLYMRIDQIMLGQMLGYKEVGIYSAALRISEVWYFIPTTIVASTFPAIIEAREKNKALYHKRIKHLLTMMTLIALSLAIPVSLLSESIMLALYGRGFSESAQVLVIHIWTGLFVFSGVASSRWFIAENLQKYTFYRTFAGCIVNLLLNYTLIPEYGVIGSAWASVASQAIASVFFNAINKKTRPIFYLQIKSITGIFIIEKIKLMKNSPASK